MENEVRFFTRKPWPVNRTEIEERDPEIFILAQHFAYKILNRVFREIDNRTDVVESFKQKRPILENRLSRVDGEIKEIENLELLIHVHSSVIDNTNRVMCEEIIRELLSSMLRVS